MGTEPGMPVSLNPPSASFYSDWLMRRPCDLSSANEMHLENFTVTIGKKILPLLNHEDVGLVLLAAILPP